MASPVLHGDSDSLLVVFVHYRGFSFVFPSAAERAQVDITIARRMWICVCVSDQPKAYASWSFSFLRLVVHG